MPGAIPTVDIYIRPRLTGATPVRYIDTKADKLLTPLDLPAGTFAIVVRHLSKEWGEAIAAEHTKLSGLAYLIDDDMPAALSDVELPLRYAFRTSRRYARTATQLSPYCSEIWFSTSYLQRQYRHMRSRVVPPLYIPRTQPLGEYGPTYFYHGTASHRREMEWLVEIVRQVQSRHSGAEFEIFGGWYVRRLFRGIPRVSVRRPLSWSKYLDHCNAVTFAVGLAPGLDSPFNRARSHTKFFDITRCGAVGVYSSGEPFLGQVPKGAGVFSPNFQQTWAQEILSLLADSERRARLYAVARACAAAQTEDAEFRLSRLSG